MSLQTFKKKSINKYSTATKRSGIPTNDYWIYQGPYGIKDNLPSTIFLKGIIGSDGKTGAAYTASNAGFSLNGPYRNVGGVGKNMKFSKSHTPYRGINPKGWGGSGGRYPNNQDTIVLNINPVSTGVAIQNSWVKPSVLSTKGMLERRFRWINTGQYPNYWVQPVYTGNQTDTASQWLYIQNKAAANDCWFDVNTPELYVDYIKNCGSTGCQTTPARGYTMSVMQANAPYTKTLYQPRDASQYTQRVQRQCQNPVGFQKPFPYKVQTGTGVLRGGIGVYNVANACNTSNIYTVPPPWYTEEERLPDGQVTTLKDQLIKLRSAVKKIAPDVQAKVYEQIFLNGNSGR